MLWMTRKKIWIKKRLEKTLKKNLYARNVLILTKSGKKSFQFFLCATQNKALEIMKLVWNNFFHLRIYGVNLKRIDNGPYSTTVSTITATETLQKICKPVQVIFLSIFCLFFVHPSITYLNEKKKKMSGSHAWNPPYVDNRSNRTSVSQAAYSSCDVALF